MVIILFITCFVSLVEFAFLFTAWGSVGFASHDAAQLVATYGNTTGADCSVLQRVGLDINAPSNPALIKSVDIFLVDTSTNGSPVAGKENIWNYDGGSHDCKTPAGITIQIPFTLDTTGYPTDDRCNVNEGIGCSRATVDTIGVKVSYQYGWMTPFPKLVGFLAGSGPLLSQTTIMRLEPIR